MSIYDWWTDNPYETPKLTKERFEEIRKAAIDQFGPFSLIRPFTVDEYLEFLRLASYPDLNYSEHV